VTEWEVLAGPSPDALRPVARAPWAGLETAIGVDLDGGYVAVRALAGGRELGRSPVMKT
jgi:hypothetical protein